MTDDRAKYVQMCWAGLIHDPATLAEEYERRAAELEEEARRHPALATGAREVIATKAGRLRQAAARLRDGGAR